MPHLRDYGYEAGGSDDDAPDHGARACLVADRDGERRRDDACARDDACPTGTRTPGAAHPHD